MSPTAADRIKKQAGKTAAKPSTKSSEGRAASAARAAKLEPQRLSVRLPAEMAAQVRDWRNGVADDLGRPRVTFQDTVSALLDELLADRDLADRVAERIAQNDD